MRSLVHTWCESCGRSLDVYVGDPHVCASCRGEGLLARRREEHAQAGGSLCVADGSDGSGKCCTVCGAFMPRTPATAESRYEWRAALDRMPSVSEAHADVHGARVLNAQGLHDAMAHLRRTERDPMQAIDPSDGRPWRFGQWVKVHGLRWRLYDYSASGDGNRYTFYLLSPCGRVLVSGVLPCDVKAD